MLDKFIIVEVRYGLEYVIAISMYHTENNVPIYGVLTNPYFLRTMKPCVNKYVSREEAEKGVAELYEDMANGQVVV